MSEQQLILLDAIEKGHTSIVLKLLRNRVNLNVTDIYGRTPLIIAAKNGRNDILKILLEHMGTTATIEVDRGGKTALHYAAENSELSAVKTLCKKQAPLMAMKTTETELFPLDYALGDEEVYPSLLKYTQSGEVSGAESDEEDDGPTAEPYVKKKKGTGKKKKGGKKSGSKKKKKKGGKKKK